MTWLKGCSRLKKADMLIIEGGHGSMRLADNCPRLWNKVNCELRISDSRRPTSWKDIGQRL